MRFKKLVLFIIFNSLIINAKAQFSKGISLETNVHFGQIIKHTPKLTFTAPPLSTGLELHFNRQTFGQKPWQAWQGYPSVGASFLYYNLGNNAVFGDAFAVYPTLDIRFLKKNNWRGYFQIGAGIAYVTKYYNVLDNPTNNALGSNVNEVTHFKVQMEKRLTALWSASAGLSFTHFSNGSSSQPNYGINVPALNIGIKYHPQLVENQDFIPTELSKKPEHRLGMSVHLDMAFTETTIPNGPRYPVYVGSVAAVYRFSKVNYGLLGVDYELNKTAYFFSLQSGGAATKEEATQLATRWMVFGGDEIFLGPLSILLQSGIYLSPSKAALLPATWYNKLGLRYHFPPFGKPKTQFYLGAYLKAHRIAAEYLAWGLGATF